MYAYDIHIQRSTPSRPYSSWSTAVRCMKYLYPSTVRFIFPTPVATASTREYCSLCARETASFLVDFDPPKSSFLQLHPPCQHLWMCERQAGVQVTAPALHSLSWHNRERTHFLCFPIWHSGKGSDRLVRMPLLTDLSMHTTACYVDTNQVQRGRKKG